ncbi:MAG: cupin domain-containing protein [Chloroflexi bacterium]|nr:cupin domain-containing protein [Chloroflexota bacterium]
MTGTAPSSVVAQPFFYLADLTQTVEIPPDGTLSRTVYGDDSIKVVLFGFDAGQELSEHTSARPALLQVLAGQARLTLGGESFEAGPGAFVHMAAGLPHSVCAVTPLVLQLTLLPPSADA